MSCTLNDKAAQQIDAPPVPSRPDGSLLPPGALSVGPSRLEGAGMGLFASQRIEPGSWICEYVGERKSFLQVLRMEDREYVMGTGRLNCHIDATSCTKAYARYVNDNGNQRALNAEFVKFKLQGRVVLRATAEVQRGDEIYAAYGEVFWRNRKNEMKACEQRAEINSQNVVSSPDENENKSSLFNTY